MSNAARKARKRFRNHAGFPRANHDVLSNMPDAAPFQHSRKVGTPVTARAAFQARPIHSGGRQRPSRFGLTSRMKQRLAAYAGDRAPARWQASVSEAVEYVQETATKTEPALELDPKPFRIGRKRFTIDEAVELGRDGEQVIWSPRKGYEADRVAYGD